MGQVVVGIDGSPGSRKALAFALDEARMRSANLHAVHVHVPVGDGVGVLPPGLPTEYASDAALQTYLEHQREDTEKLVEQARHNSELMLTRMLQDLDADDKSVEKTVLFDRRPARRLVELVNASDEVELLVVGTRGRGELTGVLLGSVSQACVTHARVPVTVVPPSD